MEPRKTGFENKGTNRYGITESFSTLPRHNNTQDPRTEGTALRYLKVIILLELVPIWAFG